MIPQIEIEKGIPIPRARQRGRGSEIAATIERMEIGDSFVFTDPHPLSVGPAIRDAAKKLKRKVTVRKIGGDSYRAWRVE